MTQITKCLIGASFLLSAAAIAVANPQGAPKTMTSKGCYSSGGSLSDTGEWTWQSQGYCKDKCTSEGKAVFALTEGSNCWCGDELPSSDDKVDDSNCRSSCQGFPSELCGGSGHWGIWLTGLKDNVPEASGSSSNGNSESDSGSDSSPSSPASPTTTPTPEPDSNDTPTPTETAAPSTITQAGQTIVVTAPSSPDAASAAAESTSSSGPNKAGVAAGVVVGIVALAAMIGGVWLFLRTRKRRAVEEEYRRNAAINDFTSKKPDSASSLSDARLEPSVMLQRRQSDGSIADNQDYSRRILKVTNPDGRN
ncbi:MAG: hypothetical protein M1817_006755 [Caeruleum heppii]|nr:MAG: hypothetical protein M1817_006755 [Caeruleum heppii]